VVGRNSCPTPNLYAHTPDNPFANVPHFFAPARSMSSMGLIGSPKAILPTIPGTGFAVNIARLGDDRRENRQRRVVGRLVAASRSVRRHVSLPMSTIRTCELERFPPAPTKEVEPRRQN